MPPRDRLPRERHVRKAMNQPLVPPLRVAVGPVRADSPTGRRIVAGDASSNPWISRYSSDHADKHTVLISRRALQRHPQLRHFGAPNVDLRRRQIDVAEDLLEHAQVRFDVGHLARQRVP